jgi:hypothetical protein
MYLYKERNRNSKRNRYTQLESDDNNSDKWQRQRKQRLNYVCETLQKLETVSYPQFVAKVAITTGVRSHIIRTYLSEIENAGLITIKSVMICWNSQSETIKPSRV